MLRAMPEARIEAAAQLVVVGVLVGMGQAEAVGVEGQLGVERAGVVRRKMGMREVVKEVVRCIMGNIWDLWE